MYKIGEFSKITSLTIKALRYYEEQEILCPSERDKNGYRLYNDQDYERARLIALLRGLDFSIMEIRDVISNYGGEEDLSYFLKEKQAQILERIAGEKALFSAGISESEKEPALPPIKKPAPGLSRPAAPVTAGIKTVQSDAAGAVPAGARRLPMRFFPARFPKSAAGPAWAFRFHPKLPSPDKPC